MCADPALVELVDQLTTAGVPVGQDPGLPPEALGLRGGQTSAMVAVSDGRPAATSRSVPPGHGDSDDDTDPFGGDPAGELVLLDLVPGVVDRRAVGLASSAGADSPAVHDLMTILDRAGIAGLPLSDVPGLLLVRTVAMLINLAVEAAAAGVADRTDIATAMQQGVRYPRDLFAWGDDIGADRLVRLLDHLEDQHRDGHFRPCTALQRAARTGEPLNPSARR